MKKIYFMALGILAAGVIGMFNWASLSEHFASATATANIPIEPSRSSLRGGSNLKFASDTAKHESSWAGNSSAQIYRDFHETKNRAEAGDPVAQRRLAQMYERCMVYSQSPEKFARTLDFFATLKKENADDLAAIRKRISQYCNSIDGGKVIASATYESWYEEAAKRGDLLAMLRLASNPLSPKAPEEYTALISEAVNSGDPEALFAVGEMVDVFQGTIKLGAYGPVYGGVYSNFSWQVAACRAGANCGPDSYKLDVMCISTGACNASSYEDLIMRDFVPSGQLEVFERDLERIKEIFSCLNSWGNHGEVEEAEDFAVMGLYSCRDNQCCGDRSNN